MPPSRQSTGPVLPGGPVRSAFLGSGRVDPGPPIHIEPTADPNAPGDSYYVGVSINYADFYWSRSVRLDRINLRNECWTMQDAWVADGFNGVWPGNAEPELTAYWQSKFRPISGTRLNPNYIEFAVLVKRVKTPSVGEVPSNVYTLTLD